MADGLLTLFIFVRLSKFEQQSLSEGERQRDFLSSSPRESPSHSLQGWKVKEGMVTSFAQFCCRADKTVDMVHGRIRAERREVPRMAAASVLLQVSPLLAMSGGATSVGCLKEEKDTLC